MQIGIGHKGKVALRVICTGEAGHSALAPQFINAIHVACAFVNEIRTLQDRLADGPGNQAFDIPYSTVHVGRIEGGRALNIVPDAVTLDMEIRHIPESPEDGLLDEIDRAVRRIDTHFGRVGLITVETVNRYPGLMPAPPDAEVMAVARHLVPDAPTTHLAFGTEAGYFAQIGLNAVVIGPGDMASDGHKPDESLSLRQIDACDAMMDRVLDFLSRATA